jgi:hypothetical protein
MPLELDHAFIGCSPGAPEADALIRLGFVEGSGNTHPGQGTANRRFFFENFMLELVWVCNPEEAQSDRTRRTRLWERCSARELGSNPFGIVFRPAAGEASRAPYATWLYHPSYLPPGFAIEIAEGTPLGEPELFYLPFLRSVEARSTEPVDHEPPIRRILGVSVGLPGIANLSQASRLAQGAGLLSYFQSDVHRLEIQFAGPIGCILDLRPVLPLVFRGVPAK